MSDDTDDMEVDGEFLLDDIADLPALATPPSGAYILVGKEIKDMDYENAKGEKKKAYQISFEMKEVVEVKESALDEDEELPKEGDLVSMMFGKTQKGIGFMKPILTPIAEHFNTKKSSEIFEHFKGLEMMVVFKRRYNKKADRHNLNVVKAAVT